MLPPDALLESPEVLKHMAYASRRLGELNGLCASLTDPGILINTIALQESKDSLAIENIVTTQDELYQATLTSEEMSSSAKEVLSYREALYKGLKAMAKKKNILSVNIMIEIVQVVKQNKAGIRTTPGTMLKNAITGETIYTPPEGKQVIEEKLANLERFMNDDDFSELDPLLKMAVIHYQFEAIYPFIDGNGRTGRILNSLYLVQQQLLPQPVLYLSSYFVKNKPLYYQLLRGVTEDSNWRDWIMYNLTAVIETAKLTADKIRQILLLKDKMETELKKILGPSYTHELLRLMFELPYLKIDILVKKEMAHRQTASVWLRKLVKESVLSQQKRGKTIYFINSRLMKILTD